ncbi:MAG: ribosome maturation factor RimP [Elusimicrobia bacterium]|nr:ribosome maturation factor RimP [Elusimicrobiota bacterium]
MEADLKLIETTVRGVLDQEAVELVDLQYLREGGRRVLRFFLDKAGGITLDDCEYLSNRIGGILDTANVMPHAYVLEVSSPGIDRILKKERDFLRFLGHRVRICLKEPLEGRRNFMGYLKMLEEGQVVLEDEGRTARFPLEGIEEARLHPELEI